MAWRNSAIQRSSIASKILAAAEFLILATSLPAEGYPADQIVAAYRLRWQIELAPAKTLGADATLDWPAAIAAFGAGCRRAQCVA